MLRSLKSDKNMYMAKRSMLWRINQKNRWWVYLHLNDSFTQFWLFLEINPEIIIRNYFSVTVVMNLMNQVYGYLLLFSSYISEKKIIWGKNLLLTSRKFIKNASIATKHKIKQLYIPVSTPSIYTCTRTCEVQCVDFLSKLWPN